MDKTIACAWCGKRIPYKDEDVVMCPKCKGSILVEKFRDGLVRVSSKPLEPDQESH